MPSFNKVFLMGNVTRDPELRMTPKGSAVATLGLAVNRTWKDESGQEREEVLFVDVEAFGKQAETLVKYLKKGRPLFVEGRLRLDQWEDKQTKEKRQKMKVILESFQFLGGREDAPTAAPTGEQAPRRQAAAAPRAAADTEDEVPF